MECRGARITIMFDVITTYCDFYSMFLFIHISDYANNSSASFVFDFILWDIFVFNKEESVGAFDYLTVLEKNQCCFL